MVGRSAKALSTASGGSSLRVSWNAAVAGEGVPEECDIEEERPSTNSEFFHPWHLSLSGLCSFLILMGLEESFTMFPYLWQCLQRKGTPS
jgi:hypothetical protein